MEGDGPGDIIFGPWHQVFHDGQVQAEIALPSRFSVFSGSQTPSYTSKLLSMSTSSCWPLLSAVTMGKTKTGSALFGGHVHGHKQAFGAGQASLMDRVSEVILILFVDFGHLACKLGVNFILYAVGGHSGRWRWPPASTSTAGPGPGISVFLTGSSSLSPLRVRKELRMSFCGNRRISLFQV